MWRLDVKGVFGAVCSHGFVHILIIMEGGENWRFATGCLLKLSRSGSLPASFFYDIACRYNPYWVKAIDAAWRCPMPSAWHTVECDCGGSASRDPQHICIELGEYKSGVTDMPSRETVRHTLICSQMQQPSAVCTCVTREIMRQ